MKNLNKFLLILLCFTIYSCQGNPSNNDNKKSIYDYTNDQILGDPIRIDISEAEQLIYKIEADTLIDSLDNILLFGGVSIEVYNDNNKTNDIFSEKAIVYSKSDSMSAYGNVKIISSVSGYELYTNKIMLFNKTKLVRSKEEVLFINDYDSLRGIGFWSDFDMINWKIDKPIGTISKVE